MIFEKCSRMQECIVCEQSLVVLSLFFSIYIRNKSILYINYFI